MKSRVLIGSVFCVGGFWMSIDHASKQRILTRILGDKNLADYLIRNKCVDDYVVARLVEIFGVQGIVSLRNFGKGYSRRYKIILEGGSLSTIYFYTFQGKHGEYIILPFSGYCGCYSRFPLNITRRYPCYHLISFSLDLAVDFINEYDYEVDSLETLIVNLFYDSLVKEK